MNVLDDLQGLSSAEEFFGYLAVPFVPEVVQVARLHIMRRMGQYLKGDDVQQALEAGDEQTLFALCKTHLAQAYDDFVASSPIAERVFKVHQDAILPKQAPTLPFVPLTALTQE
ncbi:nitrogen fixation protein NifW [Novosphingobium sp. Rr 2-17]|uniref:nitrogenase stabilizing/protective protein NifW n=1 Tax=Novosphingobium sp. Rr 2-17 TaxID=555793 RepID=UPI000269A7E6|nr:nitrogenase stabilizing/protective protein NifW [Novosphingobium sp. Rr 2-17]EIZ79671.1 nitrogen fixation protein NifW [Novosphingobium sp. Rr 2-17]